MGFAAIQPNITAETKGRILESFFILLSTSEYSAANISQNVEKKQIPPLPMI